MSAVDHSPLPQWRRVIDFPLVTMLIAIALYAAATALGFTVGSQLPPLGAVGTAAAQAAIMLAFILPIYKLGIARLGEHPHDDLPAAGALPDLGRGIATGALLFCAVAAIAALAGAYRISGPSDAPALLLPLITSAIMPGIVEELLFRGILFRWIEEFGGSWAALLITSALFGMAHSQNPNATAFSSFAIAVEAGLLLGGAYMLTRSLWMPIGLHAAWNFTQGPILGVPVSGNEVHGIFQAKLSGPVILSGGAFGLEASVIALAVCIAAGVWFVWLAVRRGQLVQPWWVRLRTAPAS